MVDLVLCSAEEFITKSNEIINPPFDHGYRSISSFYNEHSQSERKNGNEAMACALDLASAICSMTLKPDSTNEPFQPYMIMEGRRSAIPDDFTPEQLGFIESVYSDIAEPLVQARFADLLWLCINPKKIEYARAAIRNYLLLPIDSKTWNLGVGDCWKRVIRLSLLTRDLDSKGNIEAAVDSAFSKNYPDSPYMNLWIAELMIDNRLCEARHEFVAEALYKYATCFHSSGQYLEARGYLPFAERLFKAQGNETRWLNCLVMSADCFEREGDCKLDDNAPSQIVANSFFGNALQAYRKIPVSNRDALGVTEKLILIRDKITDAGTGSLSEMGLVQTPGVDISDMSSYAKKHVEGKESLELALLCFTGFSSPKYQELRATTVANMREFPLSNLFGAVHMAGDGRVIAKTPALSFSGEGEESELAVINKTIKDFQIDLQLSVEGQIVPALNQILFEHRVTKEFLRQLCYHSPIVPEDRENLMAEALWSGFEHHFGSAIHLLCPQVENLVRNILKNNCLHTSSVDPNGIENENGLSALLDNERAEEVLGEDLLFELKAVFTSSVGPNLRNEVAHGLLDDISSSSTASVYAWWMVLRIVVRSFYNYEVASENDSTGT